jgi:hypothetical protein
MKIKIGPHRNWWGIYQLVDLLDKVGVSEERKEWLVEKLSDTWLDKFLSWRYDIKERKVDIKIDKYDTWGMDSTLALIIHPMLIQLKETKHGSPCVADKDVPKKLRSTSAPKLSQDDIDCGATDDLFFKRWDWVLDEMIWAFEQHTSDWEDQYHTGVIDFVHTPVDIDGNEVPKEDAKFFRTDKGPKDTHVFDKKGWTAHHKRMQNGFTLFGKYFTGLWD